MVHVSLLGISFWPVSLIVTRVWPVSLIVIRVWPVSLIVIRVWPVQLLPSCLVSTIYIAGPAVPAAPAGVGRFDCRGQKDDDSCRYYGLTQDAAMCDPQQGYTTMDGQTKIIELCPVSCGVCAGKLPVIQVRL